MPEDPENKRYEASDHTSGREAFEAEIARDDFEEHDHEFQNLFHNALEFHRKGDHKKAKELYKKLLNNNPDNPKILLNLASIAFDQRDFENASRLCHRVIDNDHKEPAAELLLSRISFIQGAHAQGLEHVAQAHNTAPHDPAILSEYIAAVRRSYWTYRSETFHELFSLAQASQLPPEKVGYFVHQCFAKIVRPRLIHLLIDESNPEQEAPLLQTWSQELEEKAAADLDVLARNFEAALISMHANRDYRPRTAKLELRDGSIQESSQFADLDALTLGSLELIGSDSSAGFIPFSELQSVEFQTPGAKDQDAQVYGNALEAFVHYRSGEVVKGFVPLFYLFTEFSINPDVQQGRKTFLKLLHGDIRLVVGMRHWSSEDKLIPILNVAKIEFS